MPFYSKDLRWQLHINNYLTLMKENALRKMQEPTQKAKRYKAPDKLLQFLQELDLC